MGGLNGENNIPLGDTIKVDGAGATVIINGGSTVKTAMARGIALYNGTVTVNGGDMTASRWTAA